MVIFRFLLMYSTVLVYLRETNFANGLLDSDHNEIDQCLLCARCNDPDHRGMNETREFCTKYFFKILFSPFYKLYTFCRMWFKPKKEAYTCRKFLDVNKHC